jgi:hypothetical protein
MASNQVRQKYRDLAKLVKRLPDNSLEKGWQELRISFRKPLEAGESLDARLKAANDRMSFLRIITPKEKTSNQSGTWVYKDGKRLEGQSATSRDSNGKVHSNWNGKNMDPCSVKTHKQQLKRAGFLNNSHAKGIF